MLTKVRVKSVISYGCIPESIQHPSFFNERSGHSNDLISVISLLNDYLAVIPARRWFFLQIRQSFFKFLLHKYQFFINIQFISVYTKHA